MTYKIKLYLLSYISHLNEVNKNILYHEIVKRIRFQIM